MDIGFSNTGIEMFPSAAVPTLLRTVVRANPVRVTSTSMDILSFPKSAVKANPVNQH
jgi:hypothetical protein